jgi:phospholipid/cholesterol/gamma-HCH transport system substrate-binding protein
MKRSVAFVLVAVLAAGCSTSAQDLPLPGSRVSGPTYRVGAVFDDALNLAQGAPVKVHGVTVGRVRDVVAQDFTARVNLDLRTSAVLHVGATARLRATTPLGELFVQIDDVDSGARLRDGAMLGHDRTSAAPTIEDTMTSASLVINGGGLGQLQTIVREANLALGGHEDSARDVLGRMARTEHALNESSDDIDVALDALADVSTTLNQQRATTNAALKEVAPAARVLRKNTDELVALLRSIDRFGAVAADVIDATQADLLSTLRKMGPVFDELNALEDELGPGIDTLVRFAGLVDRGVPTDYLNTYLHFQGNALVGIPGLTSGTASGAPPVLAPDLGDPKNLSKQPLGGLEPVTTTTQKQPGLLGGLLGLFGGGR